MKLITTTEGAQVMVFSQADEMPIGRYNAFQKYLLIESGIGNTMEAVDGHYVRMVGFMQNDDKGSAIKEAENNRHCIVSILNGINYTSLAFACMAYSINEIPCEDITEEGLSRTVKMLQDVKITQQVIVSEVEELKKK